MVSSVNSATGWHRVGIQQVRQTETPEEGEEGEVIYNLFGPAQTWFPAFIQRVHSTVGLCGLACPY